jgi:hypothetical protein
MKKKQQNTKGIPTLSDKDAYQLELRVEQERVRRKKALDALKETEKREVQEKAGQGNLFAPKNNLPQG